MEAPFTRKTSRRYAGFHGKPPISRRSHWQRSPRGGSAIAEPHKGSAGYVGFSGNRPAALPRTPLQPSGGQFPDKLPEFGADTPMGRPGQPAELAPIYVLLATNEDRYSTGQVYGAVDGNGGP